ncbi:MAG TPA: glycoside hydrolase family 2 TIM barrel-domain containing protein [Candidatus Brocadiia bacterium]|nr:glycoside hydrolase family 2 TIM barrel-domain containing protein [Candidatus Brocadiia bacterium]
MGRLIEDFPRRERVLLDGVWGFVAADRASERVPPRAAFRERLAVPGVWEMSLAHFRHRGLGWFQRDFETPWRSAAGMRLVFEAVSHTAEVWLDGQRLGGHYGAHTPFELVAPAKPGARRLVVRADNRFGPDNPLTTSGQDIYTYGGIPRGVYVERLPDVHIRRIAARPVFDGRRWWIEVEALVAASGGAALPREGRVALDGRQLGSLKVNARGQAKGRLAAGGVAWWSPDMPSLHMLTVEAGEDLWQDRVGFRTIEAKGRRLLLNGKPLILQGVNRHEFHPHFGPAVPPAVHLRDIEILKQLGANFVRGSHYPNDPLFLDLCDENGILFWEELSHWQATPEQMTGALFRQRSLEQAQEMIRRDERHPCVILWGALNEARTDTPEGRETARMILKRFRQLDPTRLVTLATSRPEGDLCFDLVDVASANIYPGWYVGSLEDLDKQAGRYLDIIKRRSRGKPVILSEFGAAGVAGARSFELRKWTEDYQAELLRRMIGMARSSGFISGVALWQYCDVRTSADLWSNRAREYNNKGIVTEHREPKAAFAAVAAEFAKPWKPPR